MRQVWLTKEVFLNHKEQTDHKNICKLKLNIHENLMLCYHPEISSVIIMGLEEL